MAGRDDKLAWVLAALVCASACASENDDPIDDAGGSSEGDGADEDSDGDDDDDDGSSDAGDANLDPVTERCTELFLTEDEIEDCVGFAEASLGDPMALIEACTAFDTDFRQWECLNAGAAASWPPEDMIEACASGGADLSRVRACVLGCADAPEDPTADFAACNGDVECMIEQCW